ncbi:MAG: CYTH domain-containing protein [Magnetococcales bacterium]|nr:CYTH domain-containing protein [Magnetococcales bacterium]
MALEQEIKLTPTDPAVLDQLADDPLILSRLSDKKLIPEQVTTTYLDTPDHALLKNRLAFRVRQTGNQWSAGFKGNGAIDGGVLRLDEWETPISREITCLNDLPEGPVRKQIPAGINPVTPLVPLMVTDIRRHHGLLILPGETTQPSTQVELALDHGEIRANNAVKMLAEVELELHSGDWSSLVAFADLLTKHYPLTASVHSKFAWGLTLFDPEDTCFSAL